MDDDSLIVKTFGLFGSFTAEHLTLSENGQLHEVIHPLETFVCLGYSKDGAKTLPVLRWDLFRTKNLESELLPPTTATLLPHIQRTNYVCKVGKAYVTTHPKLPTLVESGWILNDKDKTLKPVLCLYPPAPKGVIELVKCACKAGASCGQNCSCKKAKRQCTSMCKCKHI